MLKLRNTLTKKIEQFPSLEEISLRPEDSRFVSIYTCGPTVYDYASIGNFSAYIMADLVKRYVHYLGYPVKHVINITDVGHLMADADVEGEDKLEAAAKKEGIDPYKIAEKYTSQFLADAANFGITADVWPKASDHIPEMIQIIQKLVENQHAYVEKSGVYFDVISDENYGELSGNSLDELKSGARVEVHPDKKHPADFALWKLNQPQHLMQWDSPWGSGYPGWHIECSAMSMKYLGEQIDIHTGGEDNIFPHHESEIAQSECATGKRPFVHFWLHRQFLTVDGQKMSKSLHNTYQLQDLVDKGFDPEDFRMLVLSAHYRSGVNFTWEALRGARERRMRWKNAFMKFELSKDNIQSIINVLDNDLNTPEVFAIIDGIVKQVNVSVEHNDGTEVASFIDKLFGLGLSKVDELDAGIEQKRQALDLAREQKDYAEADKLRSEIIAKGYEVITTEGRTEVRKH